jgi:hypothetical protein
MCSINLCADYDLKDNIQNDKYSYGDKIFN